MTGTGGFHYNTDRFTLNVNLTGNQTCPLIYTRKGEDAFLNGDCNGVMLNETGKVHATDFVKANPRELQRFMRVR